MITCFALKKNLLYYYYYVINLHSGMHTFNVHFNVYSWLKNDSKRKVATTSVTLSDGVFHVQHECWLEVISGVWESGFFFNLVI